MSAIDDVMPVFGADEDAPVGFVQLTTQAFADLIAGIWDVEIVEWGEAQDSLSVEGAAPWYTPVLRRIYPKDAEASDAEG